MIRVLVKTEKKYLLPCLQSHNPLDVVIIMLGTNDLKTVFNRSANDIAEALDGLVEDVKKWGLTVEGNEPQIILVSPIHVNVKALRFAEFYADIYDDNSGTKSQDLSKAIKMVAEQKRVIFVDAAKFAKPGEDGIHIDTESQEPLARAIAEILPTLMSRP